MMSCLLYCILDSRTDYRPRSVSGVGDRPVSMVTTGGLGAALSSSSGLDLRPDTTNVLAYHKVIAAFHRYGTVIPLRYGLICEDASQVVKILDEQRERYMSLLIELQGCVEMGISILLPSIATSNAHLPSATRDILPDGVQELKGGRAFLAARRAHYARLERTARTDRACVEQCRAAFAGMFIKCNVESPTIRLKRFNRNSPLSLYFLVPRDSLSAFRGAFRRMSIGERAKVLISGPWPPYNFVQPDSGSRACPKPDSIINRC